MHAKIKEWLRSKYCIRCEIMEMSSLERVFSNSFAKSLCISNWFWVESVAQPHCRWIIVQIILKYLSFYWVFFASKYEKILKILKKCFRYIPEPSLIVNLDYNQTCYDETRRYYLLKVVYFNGKISAWKSNYRQKKSIVDYMLES